ncbi:hypothetical protein D3248_06170 [Leucobacter zeae]|nr:hypothetical protein [Leucobacter zeae]
MRKKRGGEARESALASGWTVEGDPDPGGEDATFPDPADTATPEARAVESAAAEAESDSAAGTGAAERAEVSNAMLVLLGVFGGLYLLYTWGWLVVAKAYSTVNALTAAGSGSLGGVLQQIVFWAAPLAPLLWFITALVLNRGGRTGRLAVMLVVGAVVLLPLPMLIARGA